MVLGIDTSGKTAAAAIVDGDVVLAQTTLYSNRTHSQIILPLCKDMLEKLGITLKEVNLFAVAAGPGSYTGLRIGISAIQAIAYALGKPCAGISTLEGLAYNLTGFNSLICSVMKARAELVYAAVFRDTNGSITRIRHDKIIPSGELAEMLSAFGENVIINGDGAEDFLKNYNIPNAKFAPPHLRLQLASGICFAARTHEPLEPVSLRAAYLEPTKAEKELIDNGNK